MSEWISIKDKFPDKEGLYLVFVECTDGNTITIFHFTQEHKFSGMPIKYWMPLPRSPHE